MTLSIVGLKLSEAGIRICDSHLTLRDLPTQRGCLKAVGEEGQDCPIRPAADAFQALQNVPQQSTMAIAGCTSSPLHPTGPDRPSQMLEQLKRQATSAKWQLASANAQGLTRLDMPMRNHPRFLQNACLSGYMLW